MYGGIWREGIGDKEREMGKHKRILRGNEKGEETKGRGGGRERPLDHLQRPSLA